MELIEGRSLEQVIDEEGPLPPRLVAEIGVDLLGALRAAHSQGIRIATSSRATCCSPRPAAWC